MKNRLLTTAACLLILLAGQAQVSESAQRIHEKIEAFVVWWTNRNLKELI